MARLVQWAMQCNTPNMKRACFALNCVITHILASWKIDAPSTPKVINLEVKLVS